MRTSLTIFVAAVAAVLVSCQAQDPVIKKVTDTASAMLTDQIAAIDATGKILFPNTITADGSVKYIGHRDWRVGFFPGTLWCMYELTGEEKWKNEAERFTEALEDVQYLTSHHDIGFMIGSSYLRGYRDTGKQEYIPIIIQSAKSLCTRFRPGAGVIQSWDADKGWQGTRGWECPVIIDNMMNLELLFEASKLSGDESFRKVAVSHADKTLENHFREDASCCHVVDYEIETGKVRSRQTAQGYAHESSWSRGQAWALYGYTMCYRYTSDPRYLEHARKVAAFILNHPRLPEDLVPYWDFDAPGIPDEPRDASAAAIIASALYELEGYSPDNGYRQKADKIVESLATDAYLARRGTNGNFILMHSVGSIPHGNEIDVPLSYADYYYLEALTRKK